MYTKLDINQTGDNPIHMQDFGPLFAIAGYLAQPDVQTQFETLGGQI